MSQVQIHKQLLGRINSIKQNMINIAEEISTIISEEKDIEITEQNDAVILDEKQLVDSAYILEKGASVLDKLGH